MSNLIESLIEKNYKKANELVKEHIHNIVERKMCEMKKMVAARKSEEQLDEAAKKKPKDPTASAVAKAQSLMQIMQAREAGRKIPNPKPKTQKPSELKQAVKTGKELHNAMRIHTGQKAAADKAQQEIDDIKWEKIRNKIRDQRQDEMNLRRNTYLQSKQKPKTLMQKLKGLVTRRLNEKASDYELQPHEKMKEPEYAPMNRAMVSIKKRFGRQAMRIDRRVLKAAREHEMNVNRFKGRTDADAQKTQKQLERYHKILTHLSNSPDEDFASVGRNSLKVVNYALGKKPKQQNIDEGKITKMLPGAIRKQIVKLKAERHYGKAREKAGKEYSASVKSKDIDRSYIAAKKMGRLGRKARNPGEEVVEKGKKFFRGKQQNEELMLPSGQAMMSTGEVVEQSVAKARRGLT